MSKPMSQDPIQVWEEEAGPPDPDGHKWTYVAYRDAEANASYYGYGHTPHEATLDFLRNEIEEICSNCTDPCSKAFLPDDPEISDCIMTDQNTAAWLRKHMPPPPKDEPEDDTSHRIWRDINGLP
jgi:hypothetical protein